MCITHHERMHKDDISSSACTLHRGRRGSPSEHRIQEEPLAYLDDVVRFQGCSRDYIPEFDISLLLSITGTLRMLKQPVTFIGIRELAQCESAPLDHILHRVWGQ
jgi:hypothetical protein